MKYIPEIDGVRALAVMSVLLFHLGVTWLPGGFVGVDIFFVISGYLITSIIANDLRHQRFSFANFYARRMLRILPALYATLLFIALAFFVLLPPLISAGILDSMYAAILSYSNLLFYFTIDYFGENITTPTLHFWSLAVEEQFYLLMPLIFWLVWLRGRRNGAVAVFLLIFTASLLAAGYTVGHNQSGAFYFPWLRAWELMAGSLTSFVTLQNARVKRLLAEGGLVTVIAVCVLYDTKLLFPGFSALLPVLGTCALILGAGAPGLANLLLRQPLMQWLGKISYSLYLVHWPMICLGSLIFTMTFKCQVAVLLISLLLGHLSWRYVETPFRRMTGKVAAPRVFAFSGAISVGFALFFIGMHYAGIGLWNQYPKAVAYSQVTQADVSYFHRDTCFLTTNSDGLQYFRQDQCLKPSTQARNVLVIGDSHAANIVEALRAQFPHVHFMQATATGCKPTLDTRGAGRCVALIDFILRDWLPRHPGVVDQVVLASRWDAEDLQPLAHTLDYLQQRQVATLVYGPTPEFLLPVPLMLAYEEIAKVELSDHFAKSERIALDQQFRARFGASTTYFSPLNNFCSHGNCATAADGQPMFFDRDHMTLQGAERAVRGIPLLRGEDPGLPAGQVSVR